jgi:tetratricopeptide (TPR) repeat protein
MVRNGLLVSLCAGIAWAWVQWAGPARGEDAEGKLRTQLAVQTALQQGRDNLQRGNYQAAVFCLEKEIARIDGNREYINVLREAYRGYIRDLYQTNRSAEAKPYQERLQILDPGYQIEMSNGQAAAPPTIASLAAQSGPSVATAPRAESAAVAKVPKPYTARPQMPEENDPFAERNKLSTSSVSDVLDRAKRAYDSKDYAAADKLYAEANRCDRNSVTTHRDLWAFCKLYVATDAINKAGWEPPEQSEKEVLAALALTSTAELQRQGKELLRAIQERRLELRHVPAQGRNWPEVQSPNFRIIYNGSRDLAEQVARVAETTRGAVIRKWFGEEPKPWDVKCAIFLYPTADYYARMTGKPKDSPGHSTLQVEKDNYERVVERKIDLHCDVADMLTHVLPHETTHAVLVGRFGRHIIPRWADEGIANLSEPREKIDRFLKHLPALRSRHELFTSSELMAMKDYPQPSRITAFYVQSVSLVEYLSTQKGGPHLFTRFVRDGLESGYEAALQRHYGLKDFKELEERWSHAALESVSDSAVMSQPYR